MRLLLITTRLLLSSLITPEAHSNLGNALRDLGQLDEALFNFGKAIAINPDYAEAHSNMGVVLKELGQLDEAVISYNKAIAINSDSAKALNNLGNALSAQGKFDEAVASYDKALIVKPDYFEAYSNLGAAYVKLGKYDMAIAHYVASDPNSLNPDVSGSILECYYHQNDMTGFRQHLQIISQSKTYFFRAGAASAFVAQQVSEPNIYEFCRAPVEMVATYNIFKGEDAYENKALIQKLETDIRRDNWYQRFSPGHLSAGYKSIGNLFDGSGEQTSKLNELLRRFIDLYYNKYCSQKSFFIDNWPKNYDLDGWYIRLNSGGEISAHVHTGWLSGVLYLRLPKKTNHNEGNIEFTLRGYDLPIVKDNYPRRTINTAPGVLVLFPSSLPHRVIPFISNDERISIAFDMKPHQSK